MLLKTIYHYASLFKYVGYFILGKLFPTTTVSVFLI